MNTLLLVVAGIVTAGGALGYAFLGPLGESGTDCDSKPLETQGSSDFMLRMKVTNIDGDPDLRVCLFTHDKVQKLYDFVVQVPAGTTRSVDVEMPSRVFFFQVYHVRFENSKGNGEAGGVDDCGSRLIEIPFTFGENLIQSSSGECVTRGPSDGHGSMTTSGRGRP